MSRVRRMGKTQPSSDRRMDAPGMTGYPKLRYSSMMNWIGLRAWSSTHTS
jgi:hypothetical protein